MCPGAKEPRTLREWHHQCASMVAVGVALRSASTNSRQCGRSHARSVLEVLKKKTLDEIGSLEMFPKPCRRF